MEYKVNEILTSLRAVKETVTQPISTKLELDKCERVVGRLGSFSTTCTECQHHLSEMNQHFKQLEARADQIGETEMKQHKKWMYPVTSHLQNKHMLITPRYYLAIYMSLGMSLGVTFGLTIFDNIALGIPIGMSIGLAIGAGLDAEAKKKGRTI
jgi:hypothetical protein